MTVNHTAAAPDMPGRNAAHGRSLAVGLLDRRTREWKRRTELVRDFTAALGGAAALTPILAAKIEAAAELAVAAEMTRAGFMAGEGVTADDVVRTANQAARAEKALGIDARKQAKARPSLDRYLAETYGQGEAA